MRKKVDVVIASDHAGFRLKEKMNVVLRRMKKKCLDAGTYSGNPADYPVYAMKACQAVASGLADRGILFCGTGIGMAIAANKVPGIRAAACYGTKTAKLSRDHNDANVLVLAGRITSASLAARIIRIWLSTKFNHAGRHCRRIDQITEIEKIYSKKYR